MQTHFSRRQPHSLWRGIKAEFVVRITQQLSTAAIPGLFSNLCIFFHVYFAGSLCDGTTSQCYLLPVLDTIFVQRKYRRGGLGMKMLHDFCQSFKSEDALGISCPISAAMYQGKLFDVETLGKGHA